jgi:hypothetical protein
MIRLDVKFKGANVVIKNVGKRNDRLKDIDKILDKSLDKIAKAAKNTIITENHVITGNLRDSLKYESKFSSGVYEGIAGSLDDKVFYDIYVERLYPYLFPAFVAEKSNLMNNLRNMI